MRATTDDRRSTPMLPGRSSSGFGGGSTEGVGSAKRENTCLAEIKKLERNRADRRRLLEKARADRVAEEARNIANGNPGDVDFMGMIRSFREERAGSAIEHVCPLSPAKICIAVRKRPVNSKERAKKDHDSLSCFNPDITVHDCKLRVDGINKYLDNLSFRFDHVFSEQESTETVYDCTAKPLVPFVLNKGRATVFAYGQTGSGKTFTMMGLQEHAVDDLFSLLAEAPGGHHLGVYVSFFEIYGGRCQDLLNHRHRLIVREDGKGEVVMSGLEEKEATDSDSLQAFIAEGNRNRTTHATESNDQSSRSHAICQISIRETTTGRLHGKLSLIDLAGSERGTDTKSHNRQRRMEGAEINKSLLALKECIRALDNESAHVPYRASKLTLVLKDSFTRKGARTVMIATVSPGASSADHTINTLRYADRVKEKTVDYKAGPAPTGCGNGSGGGGRASPVDRPPPPPTVASPKPSDASSSIAGGDVAIRSGSRNATSLASQIKSSERRGAASIGSASTPYHRQLHDFKPSSKGPAEVESDRCAKATPGYSGGDGGSAGTSGRRSSSASSKHQRVLSAADSKRESVSCRSQFNPPRGGVGMRNAKGSTSLRDIRTGEGIRGSQTGVVSRGGTRGASTPGLARMGSLANWEMEMDIYGGPGRAESVCSDSASAASDINYMHESLRQHHPEDGEEGVVELHHTVQSLFEEEEALLSLHMSSIQENAIMLTEEGKLLQQIQGENVVDYDIDAYASRLSEILSRKMNIMSTLQDSLRRFRGHLEAEEKASVRIRQINVPQY